MTLAEVKKKFRSAGPDRVVINASGEAVPPFRARRNYGIKPTIVFVRDDGWMLAAPDALHDVAEGMWLDKWIAVFIRGSEDLMPYNEWKKARVAFTA
jgi:hypothetical protein